MLTVIGSSACRRTSHRTCAVSGLVWWDEALVAISKQIAAAVDINAVGNAFKIIDDFESQAKAFVEGTREPEVPTTHQNLFALTKEQ